VIVVDTEHPGVADFAAKIAYLDDRFWCRLNAKPKGGPDGHRAGRTPRRIDAA
jgi:hypothetical protein